MNSEQAAHLVDKWAKEWRQYLDGMLHKYPRQALIDLLVAVSGDGDASEDFEGLAPVIDVKSISAKVRAGEIKAREVAGQVGAAVEMAAVQSFEPLTVEHLNAIKGDAKRLISDDPSAPGVPGVDVDAARDAFTLLQEAHAGRVLQLTERQVERFTAAGLLAGVAYEVVQPMPLASEPEPTPPPPTPPKLVRPAKRR